MSLVIKGHVHNWRISRTAAYKTVEGFRGSKDMPDILDFYSLPYDDELIRSQQPDTTEDFYNRASEEMANFIWPSKN